MLQGVTPAHSNPLSANPITKSLRFRASAGGYLSRTNASSVTNSSVWTWSAWVKIGYWSSGNAATLMGNGVNGGTNESSIKFTNNQLEVINYVSSTVQTRRITTQVFRDPSSWYHIVVASNSSTAINIYVNGVQITSFATSTGLSAAAWALNTASQSTGIGYLTSAQNFDGYMAEVNFIDGQALTPSSFGQTNALTGVWEPIRYAGTYGLNGFYLPFTNTTSTTTLGYDSSGNGNNWTPNNISLTGGSSYDSMNDVPTLNSGSASNYCVLMPFTMCNAVSSGYGTSVASDGNLNYSSLGGTSNSWSSFTMPASGKYYAEMRFSSLTSAVTGLLAYDGNINRSILFYQNGTIYNNNGLSQSLTAWSSGDTIGLAINMDANTIQFYRNGSAVGTSESITTAYGNYFIFNRYQAYLEANFGQRPFSYTPPAGYKTLNTFNLPDPTIPKSNKVMDAVTRTGNGTSITDTIAFQPDLVWTKTRNTSTNGFNIVQDSVRGAGNRLITDGTYSESYSDTYGSFTTTGFTFGSNLNSNTSGNTYVDWLWKAGQGTTSTNTDGTITSTVSVNKAAGFSIVTFIAPSTNTPTTIGHGLGAAPSFFIAKSRSTTSSWYAYHSSLGATQSIFLNNTNAASTDQKYWNNTAPTSSVFTIMQSGVAWWDLSATHVTYCWTPIAGYSAFGSYSGNGSTDGPFVYLGFRPKFVLIKATGGTQEWIIEDSSINPYNVTTASLQPNSSAAEGSGNSIDFLSNGFKLRTSGSGVNYSVTNPYIYAAWAENPFKYSNAR